MTDEASPPEAVQQDVSTKKQEATDKKPRTRRPKSAKEAKSTASVRTEDSNSKSQKTTSSSTKSDKDSKQKPAKAALNSDEKEENEEKKAKKSVKRRERRGKKKTEDQETVAKKELTVEGAALLNQIAARAETKKQKENGVKTGKISMSELMGGDSNLCPELRRLRLGNLNPQSLLNTAYSQMPQLPGFPSLTHRPDPGPYSSSLRPEIFKTSMEAYASAALHCQEDGGFGRKSISPLSSHSCGRVTPDQLLPWVNFAPMFPIESRGSRPSERGSHTNLYQRNGTGLGRLDVIRSPGSHQVMRPSYQQSGGASGFQRNSGSPQSPYNNSGGHHHGGGSGARPSVSSQSHSQMGQQKTRKPFFMPYMSHEAVGRGLASTELIKGSLRVNQRNYEESYIDNPAGEDQLDLLILGIHDRNRALHGDIVVVRLKNREEWVVRENLYHAWRKGVLHVDKDDNGLPLSVPPVAHVEPPMYAELLNAMVSAGSVVAAELESRVPISPDCTYDRKSMLLIAKQSSEEDAEKAGGSLREDVHALIDNLSISKGSGETAAKSPVATSVRTSMVKRTRVQSNAAGNRRSAHKLLCEMPDEDWGMPEICLQKTAEVVFIQEQKNCRAAMGQLKVMADGNRNWALFSPTDSRMPRMLIPHEQLPIGFFERPHDYARFIFVARMDEWQATAQFARGKLERTLGEAGDIEAETEGLLFANDVDTREFSHAALSSLPISDSAKWTIDEKEFKYRKDLRDTTIFTIDPSTARDLDDALSIEACDDVDGKGTPGWEVGVHIADVTNFVVENTELDKWAAQRATSVYLVHKVVPMLPRILCEELCSLNSGVDRLSFSVVWKMDRNAKVHSTWFGRTIIRSKCKMSYEHAQDFIANPSKNFDESELPPICDGRTTADLKAKVLQLHEVALILRKGRQDAGSLRLDQPKLKFVLDDDTKLPYGVSFYQRKDSNSLVEEFMLLANMSVARHIEKQFPKLALLRRHPKPKTKVMHEVLELCASIGFPLDGASASRLSSSLRKYEGDKEVQAGIHQVLSMFMMKPMQLAQYFCTGTVNSPEDYHHYALNEPYYTHFTSPIRRYADVLVHRLLAAALGYAPPPSLSTKEMENQAQHCNDKKMSAKTVSEMSDETFFGLFVKQCGPICEKGIVVNVLDAAFDVLVLKYGVIKRVYVNRLDMARDPVFEGTPPSLTLFWNPGSGKPNSPIEQVITVCSIVDVCLSALPEPTKYQAVVKMCPKGDGRTLHDIVDKKD